MAGLLIREPGNGGLVVVHLAIAAGCFASYRSGGWWWRTAGDLLPLVAAPLLYREIPYLIAAARTPFRDAFVQGIENVLFPSQPAHTLAGRLPSTFLSELLHAGYLAYYPTLFVPPLLLYFRKERVGYARTVMATTITALSCWAIFVAFPVEGPRYLWSAPPGIPDGTFRRLAVAILAAGSSRGAAFPSSHMAVSLVQALMAWRWQRTVSYWLFAIVAMIAVGAVYGGFHYASDMVAGAAFGMLIWTAVRGWR